MGTKLLPAWEFLEAGIHEARGHYHTDDPHDGTPVCHLRHYAAAFRENGTQDGEWLVVTPVGQIERWGTDEEGAKDRANTLQIAEIEMLEKFGDQWVDRFAH